MNSELTTTVARRNDSLANTFVMAFTVSLVCSVLVSTAVIMLRPIQQQNQLLRSGVEYILPIVESMQLDLDPDELPGQLVVRIVELETGEIIEDIDAAGFAPGVQADGTSTMVTIPDDEDIAGIGRRSPYATVYLIEKGSQIQYILLPVYGRGMWSTLHGYLALEGDANTIAAIKFYDHGETPGIGDKIDDSSWLAQWRGKLVYENNTPMIRVVKSRTPTTSPYEIDAITGATLTSEGISRLLKYWLGASGFQAYLDKLRHTKEPL